METRPSRYVTISEHGVLCDLLARVSSLEPIKSPSGLKKIIRFSERMNSFSLLPPCIKATDTSSCQHGLEREKNREWERLEKERDKEGVRKNEK